MECFYYCSLPSWVPFPQALLLSYPAAAGGQCKDRSGHLRAVFTPPFVALLPPCVLWSLYGLLGLQGVQKCIAARHWYHYWHDPQGC